MDIYTNVYKNCNFFFHFCLNNNLHFTVIPEVLQYKIKNFLNN